MTDTLIARVLPYFPGSVQGTGGIIVSQAGNIWTIGTPPGFSIDGSGSITIANTFSSWTPICSANVGTLGTTTINAARFLQLGKLVHFYLDVSITSAGTSPAGQFIFTLPVPPKNQLAAGACAGWENTNSSAITGYIFGTGQNGRVATTTASPNIMLNGNRIIVSGMYEAA